MTSAQSPSDLSLLFPFYVNGTLSEADRARVEAARDASPEIAAELDALSRIRATWQAEHDLAGDGSPGEAGLDRLMADIDVLERAMPAPEPIRTPAPANTNAPLIRRLAALAAAAVVGAVFTLALVQDARDIEGAQMVSGPGFEAGVGTFLTVRFRDDAALSEISDLLESEGLVIVDGPSAARLYRLSAMETDLTPELAESLRARGDIFEIVNDPE